MPASQYANENQFNEILLTEQDLVHGGSQSTELLHGAAKFFLREDRGYSWETAGFPRLLGKRPGIC